MAIRLHHVNFFYGNNQALFDINLDVEKGDVVVLCGTSYVGKSSLIKFVIAVETFQMCYMLVYVT